MDDFLFMVCVYHIRGKNDWWYMCGLYKHERRSLPSLGGFMKDRNYMNIPRKSFTFYSARGVRDKAKTDKKIHFDLGGYAIDTADKVTGFKY